MSNCAERHLDVYTSSAFHIRILQQNGDYHLSYAGSVDCLSLKLLLWNLLGQGVTVYQNDIRRYDVELDAPCTLQRLICSWWYAMIAGSRWCVDGRKQVVCMDSRK